MNKTKRFSALVLTLAVAFSSISFSSYAAQAEKPIVSKVISQEERDADIQRQVDAKIASLQGQYQLALSDRDYTYDTEYVQTKYVTKGGYAGGQPKNGTRFPTGGGFSWSDEGGPAISASVSFSKPFKYVDITIELGVASVKDVIGYSVDAPNKTNYFKLYVSKTMEVRQANIYRTNIKTGKTTLYMTMYPSTLDSYDLSAKKVK